MNIKILALSLVSVGMGHAAVAQTLPARALVDRSVEAMGGAMVMDRFAAGARFRVVGAAVSPSAAQARSPRASENVTQQDRRYVFDMNGGRAKRESNQVSPGPIRFHNLAVATRKGTQTVDLLKWRSGTDIQRQPAATGEAALAAWARLLPHTSLRQALDNVKTLKSLGEVERDGRMLDAVAYKDPVGAEVTLLMEKTTGVLAEVSPGEFSGTAYQFGEYTRRDQALVPQRLTIRSPVLHEELRYTYIDAIKELPDDEFDLPPGYSDPPSLGEPRAVKVGPNVYRLDGMPSGYHTIFVVDGTNVSVLDAPLSKDWTLKAVKIIRLTVGEGARVTRVLVSHHHGDHTGGLATYVQLGATVVCGKGVSGILRSQLGKDLAESAVFKEVDGDEAFGQGPGRIEAFSVPNEHADGMLAFYVPSSKSLLQGDLFYVPDRGPIPSAFPVTDDLLRVLTLKDLKISTIFGVHGRQATIDELRASLQRRSVQ